MPEMMNEEVETESNGNSGMQARLQREAEQSVDDYLKELSDDTPIQVAIIREQPPTWDGRNIKGTLDTIEDPITEEEIRNIYGGGKYKLVVKTRNHQGKWVYRAARKVEIAGDPKLGTLITTPQNGSANGASNNDAVRDAMQMSAKMAEMAERRAERALEEANSRPHDPTAELLVSQMNALQQTLAAKDEKLLEIITQKPGKSEAAVLLEKHMDGESARITALRTQFESELRAKNDAHANELKEIHRRYERLMERQDEQQKREVASLERSYQNQIDMMKLSMQGQADGLKMQIDHLGRELGTSQKEVVTLREKKDKSPIETLQELAATKDALESFSGKADEGGSMFERIVSGVANSPMAEGIAARIAMGPEAMGAGPAHQPQPQEEPELPFNHPVTLPDGRVIMKKSDGTIIQIRRKEKAITPTGEPGSDVSDEDIAHAVQFMESALAGEADPVEFARTARNLVPDLASGPIQQLLQSQGVDAFLARVSKLNPGSPLLQQHGKNWTRKVAAALLES